MRKVATSILLSLLITTCLAIPAFAVCTPGTNWTSAWSDQYGETTYSMEAPCKVYIGIPFDMTARVTDNLHPNTDVGFGWAIKDNGATIAGGGFNWITLSNGQWQRSLTRTYTGDPIDHLLQFQFTDLGSGGGAHWWGAKVVGQVTVDPFPPVANNPPVVDAGANIFMLSQNQSSTVLQGTASDADGNALTYRWLEGAAEVQSSRPVTSSGAAPLDLAALPLLSIGDHTFTLEVNDGTAKVTDNVLVSVENSAPVAVASAGGTFNIGDDIRLNGTVADFDGDTVSYRWLDGATVLAAGQVATVRGGNPVSLPEKVITGGLSLGTHIVTLEVTDGINKVTATSTVNVIDTVAPTMAPVASTTMLWPPNCSMTEVTINTNARDNSGGPIDISVLLTTNQPQQKGQGGELIPDWSVEKIDQASGVVVLQLRNSRSGKGGDKVYDITLTATDASGNASSAKVTVKAPHDKRRLDVPRQVKVNGKGK